MLLHYYSWLGIYFGTSWTALSTGWFLVYSGLWVNCSQQLSTIHCHKLFTLSSSKGWSESARGWVSVHTGWRSKQRDWRAIYFQFLPFLSTWRIVSVSGKRCPWKSCYPFCFLSTTNIANIGNYPQQELFMEKGKIVKWRCFCFAPLARRSCVVLLGPTPHPFAILLFQVQEHAKVPQLFCLSRTAQKPGKAYENKLGHLTISGLSFLNWTWFFLPSVSYICVIIEPLLVAFLANIVGSGRSPMNLRMITHTTREACRERRHSQTLPSAQKASHYFFLLLPSSSC